ncbi:MAG: ABC transporter ATP-binding protein [Caulobacteraceae bacterium]
MIVFENVSKTFDVYKSNVGLKGALKNFFNREITSKVVLNNISFEIGEGKIVGLLGPNGAGKTTTLKILSGLLQPTSGIVRVGKYDPFEKKKEFKKMISFVMGQKTQLWWDLSAMESFILNKSIYEIEEAQFKRNLNTLVDLFKAWDYVDIQVRRLSFGQRMKLEIINSLLHNPKVIFLDEPTIGLDFDAQNSIREFIKQYNREYKATFIITSHYLNDIEAVCDDIIIINKGEKVINDSIKNLLDKFANYKTLKVTFKEPVNDLTFIKEHCEHVEYEEKVLTVKAEKQAINTIASYCFSNELVEDICVEEIPFEHIIRTIYSNGGE